MIYTMETEGAGKVSDRIPLASHLFTLLLTFASGCQLLGYFDHAPPDRCEVPGRQEQLPCGPCLKGLQLRVCGQNLLWHREGPCLDNPYDADQDGYGNESCEVLEEDPTCCGVEDCDDDEARRYPGALVDFDGDDRYDTRCCTEEDDPRCTDCDDSDVQRWNGHADSDGDGYDAIECGGIDCDDTNAERWNGHADFDGDGHTDIRCCTPETVMCDDCNDDDEQRWMEHADLDWDGHDDVSCGGDDCDDSHPLRWMGHADVDGDGHVDDRCCPDCEPEQLDCNDNDPRRWTGNSDLDRDGRHDERCRCDPERSLVECNAFDDCDDDCLSCFPGGVRAFGDALDHDCSSMIDELEREVCDPVEPEIVGSVDTGDSRALVIVGSRIFVGSVDGLYEVDITDPEIPENVSSLATGSVSDVAVWGDLVLVTTSMGLTVVRRRLPGDGSAEMVKLAGPIDTGFSRGVHIAGGYAYVASYEGLYIVDLSAPETPVIVSNFGEPLIHDASDVLVHEHFLEHVPELLVLSATSGLLPEGGGLTSFRARGVNLEQVDVFHLPGANLIENGCIQWTVVSTDVGLTVLNVSPPSPNNVVEVEGLNRFFTSCEMSLLATDDGLTIGQYLYTNDPGVFVATGRSHDVDVSGGHAFVATDLGLRVVRLGCEQ